MEITLLHKKLLLVCCLGFLISCNLEQNKEVQTWFGGEIINPQSDYVVLTKDNVVIDTIPLDRNNFFKYELTDVEPGLYSFVHREYQLVHIEPGDSIMLRVNTVEFDESLAYSGKGSEKNNFLIDMFLHNEQESKFMPNYYQKDAATFGQALDSMRSVRLKQLNEFNSKNQSSERFKAIAQASIDFDFYAKKEMYPFGHYGSNHLENMTNLPSDFYAYRNNLDYGNHDIFTYYPYYRFLTVHLDNLAYTTYMNRAKFDRNSEIHIRTKLALIDSIITHDSLKDNLMYASARRFVLNSVDSTKNNTIATTFLNNSQSGAKQNEFKKLLNTCNNMVPGNTVPNQVIVTTDNTLKDLHSIINKPTVLFFWTSSSSRHNKRIHSKAAEMKEKYPEFNFYGFCLDSNPKKWLKLVASRAYNKDTEFRFDNPEKAENELVIINPNKAIIVDASGKVVENNTNIFGSSFELELLSLLNK